MIKVDLSNIQSFLRLPYEAAVSPRLKIAQLQIKVLLILLQNVRASATFRFSSSSFSLFRNSAFFMVVILLQKLTDSLGEPQILRPIHVIYVLAQLGQLVVFPGRAAALLL